MLLGIKAMENAECAICFDALAKQQVSVFLTSDTQAQARRNSQAGRPSRASSAKETPGLFSMISSMMGGGGSAADRRTSAGTQDSGLHSNILGGKVRTCRHFFHSQCVEALNVANMKNCPICRVDFTSSVEVPDIRKNPKGWFTCVDFDGDGKLDQTEVLEVMKATVLVDHDELEKQMPEIFKKFDSDGDGTVSFQEMTGPHGIVEFSRQYPSVYDQRRPAPNIQTNKKAWFEFWDEDNSGGLDMEEILRAFIKTFKLEDTPSKAIELRGILEAIWPLIDPDGSGTVEYNEFAEPGDGLADMILANLSFH